MTKIHQQVMGWGLVLPWCCWRLSVWKSWFASVKSSWTSFGGLLFVSSILARELSGGLFAVSRTFWSVSSWTLLGFSENSSWHSSRVSGSNVFGSFLPASRWFSGFLDNSEWSETVLKSIWLLNQVKSCQNEDNQRGTKCKRTKTITHQRQHNISALPETCAEPGRHVMDTACSSSLGLICT